MRATIIVDLGFGDSGKGLLTDFLVRTSGADLIVRYNGGAQAAHNVVTPDGRHHTFSQFGAGMFNPHVRTFLSRHVVVHPTALLVEGDILETKGVQSPFSRLRVSDQALVITPFHQAANRIRESVRGASRHGSCGVGVGETVEDAQASPENSVRAGDLKNTPLLRKKLRSIRDVKREQLISFCREYSIDFDSLPESDVFSREEVIATWIAALARFNDLGLVASDSTLEGWFRQTKNVVFEGAQGVLLDADAGFHPFTTWSRCTSHNALDLIHEMAPVSSVVQIGVLRSFMTRHGPGPLPTETETLKPVVTEHTQHNEWQGDIRYGWFDAVLARYALEVNGGVDFLAITHLDVLPRLPAWKYCSAYENFDHPTNAILTDLRVPSNLSLEERELLTRSVSTATPQLQDCEASEETVIQTIESLTGLEVGLVSRGPRALDVEPRDGLRL